MAEHHSGMENLSVLVLDGDLTSLVVISKMLENLSFQDRSILNGALLFFPFQTEHAALDFLKRRAAKEEELDLILAEVHVSNRASRTLANSELLNHIMSELHVPFVSMCCNDDEEAISECMAIGACFHLSKPLTTGSFNMLRHTARQHKSKRATPEGTNTFNKTVSSSTEMPKEMVNLQREILCQRESKKHEEPEVYKAHFHSNKLDRLRLLAHSNSNKRNRLMWTDELHEKFLEALEVLGDKSAKPNKIMKQMNVKDLTLKHIASHLQKHRLRLKAHQEQVQQNASNKPVLEPMRSAHNASTTESVTLRVATDVREGYPSRLWTNEEKMSAEPVALEAYFYTCAPGTFWNDSNSVWDNYPKSVQNDPSWSSRLRAYEQSAKIKDVARDEGISREGPKSAGEIGYGASFESSSSNSLLSSSLGQTEKNSLTETTGNNDNVGGTAMVDPSDGWLNLQDNNAQLDGTNNSSSAQMYLAGPAGEMNSFWMTHMNGPQEQLNVRLEDLLQVDEAWDESVMQFAQNQEAAVGDAPVPDPVMQFAQTQEAAVGDAPLPDPVMQFAQTQEAAVGSLPDPVMQFAQTQEAAVGVAPLPDPVMQFAQTQEAAVGSLPDPVMQFAQTQEAAVGYAPVPDPVVQFAQTQEAAVGDAPVPDPVMQFAQTQEAAVGDASVPGHVMQFAQDDIYWCLSPLVGDSDMLL